MNKEKELNILNKRITQLMARQSLTRTEIIEIASISLRINALESLKTMGNND